MKKSLVDKIEAVLITELGIGSSFILQQKLKEMGYTKETLKKPHLDKFISNLLKEYNKVLGSHLNILENELTQKFEVNI